MEVEEQRQKQQEERKARENFDHAAEDEYRKTQDARSSRYDRSDHRDSRRDYNKRDRRRDIDEAAMAEEEDAALTEKEKQAIRVCINPFLG